VEKRPTLNFGVDDLGIRGAYGRAAVARAGQRGGGAYGGYTGQTEQNVFVFLAAALGGHWRGSLIYWLSGGGRGSFFHRRGRRRGLTLDLIELAGCENVGGFAGLQNAASGAFEGNQADAAIETGDGEGAVGVALDFGGGLLRLDNRRDYVVSSAHRNVGSAAEGVHHYDSGAEFAGVARVGLERHFAVGSELEGAFAGNA
jgi:hypothetical protein